MLKQKKRRRGLKVWLTMLGVGTLASVAYAIWETTWVNPCPDPDAVQCAPFVGFPCWCEGDFSDTANWSGDVPTTGGVGLVVHANTGYCEGGVDDGDPCDADGDCTSPGTCGDEESYLLINVDERGYAGLEIATDTNTCCTDALEVRIENEGSGAIDHEPGYLELDATNGPLLLMVRDSVTIKNPG